MEGGKEGSWEDGKMRGWGKKQEWGTGGKGEEENRKVELGMWKVEFEGHWKIGRMGDREGGLFTE